MKVQQRRKELLNDYLMSLTISFVIAMLVTPLVARFKMNPLIFTPLSTILFGTSFFLLSTVRGRIRLRSFILNLLAQTMLMMGTILVCFYAIVCFAYASQRSPNDPNILVVGLYILVSPQFRMYIVGGFLLAAIINAGILFGKKLGPGVLSSWITGKYYNPREVELVFMFVDMKDSTMLAEKLGAIKFSALIRDFFSDMTLPLQASRGKVSHYIGDEAVLYWKPKDAMDKKGCIAFFKWFEDSIAERAAYYQKQYGLVPEFKAGMHMGPVVATEVGEVKSEIVFHGDVLNTAARIQSMCNEKGAKLLSSRMLASKMTLPDGVIMSALGPVHLKGKAELMEIVEIE